MGNFARRLSIVGVVGLVILVNGCVFHGRHSTPRRSVTVHTRIR